MFYFGEFITDCTLRVKFSTNYSTEGPFTFLILEDFLLISLKSGAHMNSGFNTVEQHKVFSDLGIVMFKKYEFTTRDISRTLAVYKRNHKISDKFIDNNSFSEEIGENIPLTEFVNLAPVYKELFYSIGVKIGTQTISYLNGGIRFVVETLLKSKVTLLEYCEIIKFAETLAGGGTFDYTPQYMHQSFGSRKVLIYSQRFNFKSHIYKLQIKHLKNLFREDYEYEVTLKHYKKKNGKVYFVSKSQHVLFNNTLEERFVQFILQKKIGVKNTSNRWMGSCKPCVEETLLFLLLSNKWELKSE